MKKIFLTFLIILILLTFNNLAAAASDKLIFAVPAKKAGIEMYHAWFPIVAELEKISGLNIGLNIVKDHQEMTKAMELGNVDFGYFSPIPYLLAEEKIKSEALVMRVKYGSPYYKAVFIVKKSSPIIKLKDVKNTNLALTNPKDSTSGYFVPLAMLKSANINPQNDLKKIIYSGKHINVLKTVVFGISDLGAIKSYILKDPANSEYAEKIRIIATSSFLPGSTVAVAAGLEDEIKTELKKAFLDISLTKEGREALKAMDFDGFVAAEKNLYRILSEYLEAVANGGD